MAQQIGPQHGLDAAVKREKELHPAYSVAWDKRTATLKALVAGHNEHETRLRKLEASAGSPFFP